MTGTSTKSLLVVVAASILIACGSIAVSSVWGEGSDVNLAVSGSVASEPVGSSCTPAVTPFVLYDQSVPIDENHATATQNFQAEYDEFDCEMADDFRVPAGTQWTVQRVAAYGMYLYGPGPADSFNVTFYHQQNLTPVAGGTFVGASYTYFPLAGNGMFTITLPSRLLLTSGSYFVSIQSNMNTNPYPNGQWMWLDKQVVSGSPAIWRNPGAGFDITQCIDWGTRGETCGIDPSFPDQLFKIIGTSVDGGCPTPTATSTATPTNTATNTATATPTNTPISTLGNYANLSMPLGANTTITPASAPANSASINVSTDTNFNGELEGDPATGVLRVTNAHPAGTYLVTVRAFDAGGSSTTKTFTLTVTTPPACNSVSFAPAVNHGVGTFPFSVAVGDFNRDGAQDLAVINSKTVNNSLSVLLGTGNGDFGSPTNYSLGDYSYAVVVGDFNGDSKQDLAVANGFSVSILLGDGGGGFGNPANLSGLLPFTLAVGDFNSDGRQDLVVAELDANRVKIFPGDGAGGFGSAVSVIVGHRPRSIVVGDFNSDGKHDLAAFSNGFLSRNNIIIMLGDGAGNFVYRPWVNFDFASEGNSIALGDFNADGNQDIIGTKRDSTVTLAMGLGDGYFTVYPSFSGGTGYQQVAVGDFNRDGRHDLAIADVANGTAVYLGDGAGNFGSAFNFGDGTLPEAVAVGDFNGDSKQDIAVTNQVSETVSILLSNCTVAPSVSGTLTYGNAIGSQNPRYVSNVLISGAGLPNASTTTSFPGGTYALTGFGSGSYTVTPSKTGGVNGAITSNDSARIARHAAGVSPMSGNQLVVADVSGNGIVSSFDAQLVASYVSGGGFYGLTGQWKFVPANRKYSSVTGSITGEDFTALLMGEVTGNWTNSGSSLRKSER